MKFDKLFKTVFIAEQDELSLPEDEVGDEESIVPMPDAYDVEPAPIATPSGDAGVFRDAITTLDEFADKLNGVDTNSLQQTVTEMDRPGSLFQGISRETSSDIIKIAEQTRQLSEILKGFIINSAKRQRDIAAGQ